MANFDLRTTDVPTGLSVIEASAGTGKTWTISHLVPRLLVDGVVSGIGDLLLVTFTEDAARELGEQTRRQLATLVGHADAGTQPAEHQLGIRLLLDRLGALPDAARHTAVLRLRLALDESDQLAVVDHSWLLQASARNRGILVRYACRIRGSAGPRRRAVRCRQRYVAHRSRRRFVVGRGGRLRELVSRGRSEGLALVDPPAGHAHGAGAPLSLQDARDGVAQAVAVLQATRADIRRLQEIAGRDAVRLNRSAQNPGEDSVAQLDTWHATLETLDPQQLPADMFHVATRLARAKSWFGRKGTVGKAASDEAGALPIVAAAGAVEASLGVTGWAWLAHLIQAAERRYERSLRRNNAVTYDGLIRQPASCAVRGAQPRGARPAAGGEVDGGPD